MTSQTAKDLIDRQQSLAGERRPYENKWQEIAELVVPSQARFTGQTTPGLQRAQRLYDATAPLSLNVFVSAMESMLTPRTSRWHSLAARDPALRSRLAVKQVLQESTSVLFKRRYMPRASFAQQILETYRSLGAFGTGCLYADRHRNGGNWYKALHLSEYWIAENYHGIVDTLFRKPKRKPRQILQQFGEKAPDRVHEAAEKEPNREFELLHAVQPNADMKSRALDHRRLPWSSFWVLVDGQELIEASGFSTMPYIVSRYITEPGQVYGWSPALLALSDIQMVNEMARTEISARHRKAFPPLLTQSADWLALSNADQKINLTPNAINPGWLDDRGQELVKALNTGADLRVADDGMELRRKNIREAFLVNLFEVLLERPRMTATEVLQRANDKAALLAPTVGRQESETLGPLIERELDLAAQDAALPEPPAGLEEGFELEVIYESPLAKAALAEEGLAILQTMESLTLLGQVDQGVYDRFDLDSAALRLSEINGMAADLLRPEEEVEARREQRAQQQAAAAAVEAAPAAGGLIRDLAGASQTAEGGSS